ncbi:glycerol-3-phosphate dehydrogenase/oxidase [Salinisphaera aquimarina]|uniref:Glycerol-3-phosphate dehydrogenase/oxidase n=1 Tax=Salinisphaera aquimarina TaxID=2094031 RepID=A0ABV7ETF6_9GAMM
MNRAIDGLGLRSYDIAIIGGGIYGTCIARDAALRGMSVALIERGDFGQATSHNSLKLIHGGLRYLQHLDVRRVRECIRERNHWLKNAPHLIRPLDVLIPTYGHGTRGRAALWSATQLYNALSVDRNRGLAEEQLVPAARIVSRAECERRIPGIDSKRVTGGCCWTDGQMQNAARVVLECVQDAVQAGADAANYVEATRLLTEDSNVQGVSARDLLSGEQLTIRATLVINASGPWLANVLGADIGPRYHTVIPLARALNVITRALPTQGAVGVESRRSSDAVVGQSKRLYFITPWRGLSIIGTTHLPFDGQPDTYQVMPAEVKAFLDEVNQAYPPAKLTLADVVYCYGGLTPAAGLTGPEIRRARESRIIDHEVEDGVGGLLSVSGVKFTSAREVAEKAIDAAVRKLGKSGLRCVTHKTPLSGAQNYPGRRELRKSIELRLGPGVDSAAVDCLEEYGTRYERVLGMWNGQPDEKSILEARCRYAVREEMARSVSDVVLRRTAMAERGTLTESALQACTTTMAHELGWNDLEASRQKQAVHSRLAELVPDYANAHAQPVGQVAQ